MNLYSRQLHAYAYALENPAPDAELKLSPITKMGLLYFHPTSVSPKSNDMLSYDAKIQWIEIKKDVPGFIEFIGEVLNVLESPTPPKHSPGTCQWCDYFTKLKEITGE